METSTQVDAVSGDELIHQGGCSVEDTTGFVRRGGGGGEGTGAVAGAD